MGSRADSAFASRFRSFPFSGGRPRVVVALVAAMVFAVHLLSMHSGHHGDAGHDVAGSVDESAALSVAHVDGVDRGSVEHDHDRSSDQPSVGDGGPAGEVDVIKVEHPHGEVECGEITQSRLGVAASELIPALGCLWVVPRQGGLIESQRPADLPRWTPHLVRELGVQRV
ncbi:hypothetical protein [Nocardioides albertanoniae]|uniref:hypothetical protein n=1 Tax=Nocardioides albertanoniae TaxID=1175486 RepID=UPI00114E2A1B|nr:hypothetical protein [Nocardioides albertanoniae]